jgi:hypothetical protein
MATAVETKKMRRKEILVVGVFDRGPVSLQKAARGIIPLEREPEVIAQGAKAS